MPTEAVSYALLNPISRDLVAAAGRCLIRTSYPFAEQVWNQHCRDLKSGAPPIRALEQSLVRQAVPQCTIATCLGAKVSNDQVLSSVGHLWRDGWRCERDAAQHCLRFVRYAVSPEAGVAMTECERGPYGSIAGLRSYADFARVLSEWKSVEIDGVVELQSESDVDEIPVHRLEALAEPASSSGTLVEPLQALALNLRRQPSLVEPCGPQAPLSKPSRKRCADESVSQLEANLASTVMPVLTTGLPKMTLALKRSRFFAPSSQETQLGDSTAIGMQTASAGS